MWAAIQLFLTYRHHIQKDSLILPLWRNKWEHYLDSIQLQQIILLILIMINKIHLLLCLCLLPLLVSAQFFTINLDLPPNQRYTELARTKKDSIASFISYLKTNVQKYKVAFRVADRLHVLAPSWLKNKVGAEFYEECESIATGAGVPLSDIIVFNYMYELGAATDFCTAITISSDTARLLGRNLDYGYQEYLASNSVHIKYMSNGIVLFQTLGHAGFVGTHTAFKRSTDENPHQYGITLNERQQGGLHLTLQKMMASNCETSPYALMKTLKYCRGNIDAVVAHLDNFDTCAAVYYTVIDRNGRSRVIQKNRGVGSHLIRSSSQLDGIEYIVQTNHDSEVADPDGRSIAAETKLRAAISQGRANSAAIWQILTQAPNFNELTLMSGIIDVQRGQVFHQVWGNN